MGRLLIVTLLLAISYAQTEMVGFVLGDNDEAISIPVDDMSSESGRRFLQDTEPSGVDQLMLELINADRADPQSMADIYLMGDLNENLPDGTLSTDPKPPVAWNIDLWEAAHDHTVWMFENSMFSYTGEGDSQPTQRMQEAGYVLTSPWSTAENIAYSGSIYTIDIVEFTEKNHRNLIQSPGHRLTFIRDTWKEVGLSNVEGVFNGYNSVITTQDFALSGTGVFLTGVVYNDVVEDNDFYDVGEGLAGITITAEDQQNAANTFTTQSFGAGGYSLMVDPNTDYTVTFSGDLQSDGTSTSATYSVSVQEVNVKQDCVTDNLPTTTEPITPPFCLIDGAPRTGTLISEVQNPDETEPLGEVQCCHPSKGCSRRSPWSSGSKSDCISGDNDAQKYSLQQAVDMCEALGELWTLCTREEVDSHMCQGKGCSIDSTLVWAWDPPTDYSGPYHEWTSASDVTILTSDECPNYSTLPNYAELACGCTTENCATLQSCKDACDTMHSCEIVMYKADGGGGYSCWFWKESQVLDVSSQTCNPDSDWCLYTKSTGDAFAIEESTTKSSNSTIWNSIILAAAILFCLIIVVILIAYKRKNKEELDNIDPPKLDDNRRAMTIKGGFSDVNLDSEEGIILSDSPRETKIAVEMEYQSQKRKISEI